MKLTHLAIAASFAALASCATGGDQGAGNSGSGNASACLLTKDLPAYEALSSQLPSKASEGRLDAIQAQSAAFKALADKASDTSNYADAGQKLSCKFIEVQARTTLAEAAFKTDDASALYSRAISSAAEAAEYCPVNTPTGRRECALLTEFYTPILFSRGAVWQLDALTMGDAPVDWDNAESTTAELQVEVSSNWGGALAAAKASKDAGVSQGASPYDILRREYEELSCIGQRATIELSKAALKPENMTPNGELRDYDLRGQKLRASMVKSLDLASNDADRECYENMDDRSCRLKLGNQVLSAFCAAKLSAQQ